MFEISNALCVLGNYDMKLLLHLRRKNVQIIHGLDKRLAEIDALLGSKPVEPRL